MAGQPVEEGKARIKLQRQLIAKLRADTGSTDLGRELLATLEAMQTLSEDDHERHETDSVSEPSALWSQSRDR